MKFLLICFLVPAAIAMAQENPLSAFNKRAYGQVKSWVVASAEKMPEANYGFRPTDSVRTFGEIAAHLADVQYLFCSVVLGEKNPVSKIEGWKTSKSDLLAALKDAGAYCDRAYNTMTDASGVQTVKFYAGDMPKLSVLEVNIAHMSEHYGNLVTYLRMKNIVPPSTEMTQPKKQ
jgi:uncharacterized damage-inducible protein DinB